MPTTTTTTPEYDTNFLKAINYDLQGIIDPSVKQQLTQFAAERGVGMGQGAGAPITDQTLFHSFYDTSQKLRQQGEAAYSPIYQQQISEAGQTSRQEAALKNQMDIAKLEQAGLDTRQATALSAQMDQLKFSESAQDQRQAAEISAAMERLKVGNASALDLEKLREAAQAALQTQDIASREAMQKTGLASQAALQAESEKAAMDRLIAQLAHQDFTNSMYNVGRAGPVAGGGYGMDTTFRPHPQTNPYSVVNIGGGYQSPAFATGFESYTSPTVSLPTSGVSIGGGGGGYGYGAGGGYGEDVGRGGAVQNPFVWTTEHMDEWLNSWF